MASFVLKMEGNDVKKEKFGLSKLRSLLVGGSVSSEQNIRGGASSGHKQSVSKSVSHSQVSAGRAAARHQTARETFSSSVPDREDYRRDSHKGISLMTVPTHSMLAFSTSLPAQSPNGGKTVQTGGKLKLSRTTGEASVRHNDKLRRKSEIWRNDLVTAKKRKEDVNLNFKGNFQFDDEISLRSDMSNPEDHIYEEIDSDIFTSCDEDDTDSGDNFLLGISLERRNHLKFYGSAGWDFGNDT